LLGVDMLQRPPAPSLNPSSSPVAAKGPSTSALPPLYFFEKKIVRCQKLAQ